MDCREGFWSSSSLQGDTCEGCDRIWKKYTLATMWRTDRRKGRITDRKPPLEMMAASATNSQGYNLLSHVSQNIPEHQGKGTSLNLKFSYTTLLSPSQSLSSPFSALPCFYFHFHFLCYYIFIYLLFTCQVFVTPSST